MPAALAWLRQQWNSWAGERSPAELRWLAGILTVAFALRLVWVVYAMREPQGVHDPTFYFGYGQAIADGVGYKLPAVGSISAGPTAYYPVGYSAALGALFALVKHTPIPDNYALTVGYFQLVLGVAAVAMVYQIGRRLFSVPVGLLAAFWMAVFPNLIFHTATVLTETLFIVLMLAAVLALLTDDWREHPPGPVRVVVFGVLLALSIYVRPISAPLIPIFGVCLLIARAGWRRALRDTALVAGVVVAMIVPWTIRNAVQMDAFVIMSTNLGDNLCIGNHANAPGGFALPLSCFSENAYSDMSRAQFEVRRNNDNTRKAVKYAIHHPVDELKLLSRKSYHLWRHDHDGLRAVESYGKNTFIDAGLRTTLERVADVFFFVTISVGGLGLVGLARGLEARRLFLLLSILAFAGVPLIFFGDARFHVPVMPLLVVPAAWAVVEVVTFVRARQPS